MSKNVRHFLDISDVEASTLKSLIGDARAMKQSNESGQILKGKMLAMVFVIQILIIYPYGGVVT